MAQRPLLLGHRGSRGLPGTRENTTPSFDLALSHGCDGFELDVRLSGDGVPIIHHDEKIGNQIIARTPRARLLDLPSLSDILERYGTRAFLDIEIKVKDAESAVLASLREFPPERGYVVSSFLPTVLTEIGLRKPGIPLGLICERPDQLARWHKLPVEYVMAEAALVDADLVRAVHETRKRIMVWTVNEPEAILHFLKSGVDGIISDKPPLLAEVAAKRPA